MNARNPYQLLTVTELFNGRGNMACVATFCNNLGESTGNLGPECPGIYRYRTIFHLILLRVC